MFSNSEVSLTTTPDKFLIKKSLDIIETWARCPTVHLLKTSDLLTVQLFPTNSTTAACCRGVR